MVKKAKTVSRKYDKRMVAIIVLLGTIAIGGIAFAAWSTTLNIRGSASYSQNEPLVRFKANTVSVSGSTGNNRGSVSGGAAFANTVGTDLSITSAGLTVESYKVNFTSAGVATLGFTVENVGGAAAKVSARNVGGPTCAAASGSTADTEFVNALCANISVDLAPFAVNDSLAAGAEVNNGTLTVSLSAVPTVGTPGNVEVAISDTSITYVDQQ